MQHDYDINSSDAISGLQFRQDLNACLSAIKSTNSGATAPTVNVVAGMLWYDTSATPNILKIRNAANTAWVTIPAESFMASSIASASTTTIGTYGNGDVVHVTGTTTITSFGAANTGTIRTVIFDGSLTITHNATSLICFEGVDIITSTGTSIVAICEDGALGYWRIISINKLLPIQLSNTINSATSKTTPINADKFGIWDSISGLLNYVSLSNLKTTIFSSPALTGTPTAPTAASGAKTTQIATTDFSNSLVAEYTVTGSAVTSIDFTGLDLNTHKSYRIEVEFLNAVASGVSIAMFANGDTTATNYYNQRLYSAGATSVSANANNAYILFMQTSQPLKGDISIADTPSTLNATSNSAQGNTTSLVREMIAWAKTTAVANLTQITFVASVASSIGIGSKIRIYRGDV